MAEHAPAGLVEDEVPQRLVAGDEARLAPRSVSPGGGATPPTMTSPTSPSAWQLTMWMTFVVRIQGPFSICAGSLALRGTRFVDAPQSTSP